MKLYGYKKFNTPNYFPIVADKMFLEETFGIKPDSIIKNIGFANKRIRGANNPVIIEDIFTVFSRHVSDMAKYNAYVLPLEDMQRVFNYSTKVNSEEMFKSTYESMNKYAEQIEFWRAGTMKASEHFELGQTPRVLTELGADKLPVMMSQAVMEKITGGKHVIHMRDVKKIPEAIANPIMVFDSKTVKNAFVILTEMTDKKGKTIIVALHLNKELKHISVNQIASAYGKDNIQSFITEQIKEGRLRYIDKKRSFQWSQSIGLQLPKLADTAESFKNNILQKEDLVKKYYEETEILNIRKTMANKYGKKANEYIENLINDINGGSYNEFSNELAAKLAGTYKKSAMSNNLRVVFQQPTSYIRAMTMIDAKYMLDPRVAKPIKKELIFKYSPIARWKDWGFIDLDTGRSMEDIIVGKKDIADKTMWAAAKADEFTWKRLWRAVELETADVHSELQKGSEEFYKAVGKRFDEIVDRTQVVDSTLHRSQILRSPNDFTKMTTSFMSEPMKSFNLLSTVAFDTKTKPTKENKCILARTMIFVTLGMILNACVTGLYDKRKSDDEESEIDKLLEKFVGKRYNGSKFESIMEETFVGFAIENFVGDWFGMIPYIKDVYSLVSGYDVKRMDLNLVSKVISSAKMWIDPKRNYTPKYKIANNVMVVGDCLGMGVSSLKKSLWDFGIKPIIGQLGNQDWEYNIAKFVYPVNGGKKGEFIDILFKAYLANNKEQYDAILDDMLDNGFELKDIEKKLRDKYKKNGRIEETFVVPWNFDRLYEQYSAGNESSYKKMASEMIKQGVAPNDIESEMRSRYKKNGSKKTFEVTWDNALEIPKKKAEDKYGIEDLSAEQYDMYSAKEAALEKMVLDSIKSWKDELLDEYDSALSAAYTYAEETALESASDGAYESDTYWVNLAQDLYGEYEFSPAEFIKYKEKYDLNGKAVDKLQEVLEYGIDVETYLEFDQYFNDLKPPEGQERFKSGEKKALAIKKLKEMDLTTEEWNALYYGAAGYKK